jgi:hypothetical protein
MRGISRSIGARVAAAPNRALIPARAGVSTWNVRNRICEAIVACATALSLVASALATAEPAAAQWRGESGGTQGVPITIGARQPESPSSEWRSAAGRFAQSIPSLVPGSTTSGSTSATEAVVIPT